MGYRVTEVEDEELASPLTFAEVEEWVDEASSRLCELTGSVLPRVTMSSLEAGATALCSKFDIQIPFGNLFHPCCGSDTSNALAVFKDCVTAFHFVDPYNPPFWEEKGDRSDYRTNNIPYIESVITGPDAHKISEDNPSIYTHKKDGLLTFIQDIPSISIFYYRGDSHSEGGSNQNWLEPVLFHAVLSKLQDGGLIVSDGSNCGYWEVHLERFAPWNMLCGRQPFGIPHAGDAFTYANRLFRCLGEIESRSSGITWAWQVKAIGKSN